MDEFAEQLREFIANWQQFNKSATVFRGSSRWIHVDELSVYLRISLRYVNGTYYKVLDVASVTVHDENLGYCQQIFRIVESAASKVVGGVFVESVCHPAMAHICEKRGYSRISNGGGLNYFKCKDELCTVTTPL